ncbi:MAG: phosphoribosylglycinamide formyltransferase [Bacteroidales bacterium]|jgi:phosphoribosylglycinamide formyltransferase-1|nr:phosphoribosylglycinamide formyltransferase [Bacteroidales bacterium]
MKRLVVFASGSGSNAQRVAEYFKEKGTARIIGIYCNRSDAYVLKRAEKMDIPAVVFDKEAFFRSEEILRRLEALSPDLIVLAGFLWKMPDHILRAFPQKVINIHPALLPKYGGKGMYGDHVHRAVIAAGEKESGISVHYVNERYDEGAVVLQARCPVMPDDTPETLAKRIHALEYAYFPVVIEQILGLKNHSSD